MFVGLQAVAECDAGSPLAELLVDLSSRVASVDATVFDPCSQAHIYTLAARGAGPGQAS
jgi:hypothetical protein